MIYAFIFLLIASVMVLLRLEKPKKILDDQIDWRETEIISKINDKSRIVETYYLKMFIGEERLKDKEWMKNNAKPGQEVPVWRLYKITRNTGTREGVIFKNRIDEFRSKYDRIKKEHSGNSRVNNYIRFNELCALNKEIEDLFPEAFVAIKREEKLKDLGI